jgi:hypothetical protein
MEAMLALSDQLPRFDTILASPDKTKLPEGAGAYFLLAYSLAARAEADNLPVLMRYVSRWVSFEATALFIAVLAGNRNKVSMACKCREFTEAAAKIGKYF